MKKTLLIIVVCILVSLFYWFANPDFVENYLVYSGNKFVRGAFWTPFTTIFIHFDPVHLVGNMAFLYVFGKVFEEEAGGKVMVTAFLVGGVGSLIVSSFYYGFNVAMIGASGAIFTQAAAAMLIKPLKSSWLFLFIPLGLVAILFFIFNVLAVNMNLSGNVGYFAHVAGFILGIPFGIAFSKGEWLKNLGLTILMFVVFLVLIYIIQVMLGIF